MLLRLQHRESLRGQSASILISARGLKYLARFDARSCESVPHRFAPKPEQSPVNRTSVIRVSAVKGASSNQPRIYAIVENTFARV
ncbi:hypothetical protein ACLKA6_000120 [Drosophila palustris]